MPTGNLLPRGRYLLGIMGYMYLLHSSAHSFQKYALSTDECHCCHGWKGGRHFNEAVCICVSKPKLQQKRTRANKKLVNCHKRKLKLVCKSQPSLNHPKDRRKGLTGSLTVFQQTPPSTWSLWEMTISALLGSGPQSCIGLKALQPRPLDRLHQLRRWRDQCAASLWSPHTGHVSPNIKRQSLATLTPLQCPSTLFSWNEEEREGENITLLN